MKYDFAVVIPMANESEDFNSFVSSLRNEIDKLECGRIYFVIDNASKDNTLEMCNILSSNDAVKIMQELDNNQLWELMGEQVHKLVTDEKKVLFIETIKPCLKSADEALFWAKCLCTDDLTHGDEGRVVVCKAGHDFYQAGSIANSSCIPLITLRGETSSQF